MTACSSIQMKLFDDDYTAKDIAREIGCSQRVIYSWVRKGLPATKIGKQLYFSLTEVQQWLHSSILEGTVRPDSIEQL